MRRPPPSPFRQTPCHSEMLIEYGSFERRGRTPEALYWQARFGGSKDFFFGKRADCSLARIPLGLLPQSVAEIRREKSVRRIARSPENQTAPSRRACRTACAQTQFAAVPREA